MYTSRNKTVGIGLILALLIVTTLGSIGWYISRPQSKVLADNADTQQPAPKQDLSESSEPVVHVENGLPQS
jgi:hypothetical protein